MLSSCRERLFHHVDGVFALDVAGAEPGGARDHAVRAIATDDDAGAVFVNIRADGDMIGMKRDLAHQAGCGFDVWTGQREQQIVELAPPDHQIQRIGRSIIHHKPRRRFKVDLAHPTGGDVRERVLEVRKSRQGPRADATAAGFIARKRALIQQERFESGFTENFSRGGAGRARTRHDDIESGHSN